MVSAVVIFLAGLGILAFTKSQNSQIASDTSSVNQSAQLESPNTNEAMPKTEELVSTENSTMTKDKMTDEKTQVMQKSGSYKDYSASLASEEAKAGNKVVLFFHAPWCPFCKTADTAFKARLNEIPAGVTVLKTDYDSNAALKQKYGVTYQHTFVQIDAQNNQVSKWNGGDIDNLKKYLK